MATRSSKTTSGCISQGMKTEYQRDSCTPMFIAMLFTIAKTWKQPKCLSADEWLKMMCTHTHTHTHKGVLFRHEKEGNSVICDNMDRPERRYAKWNKPDKGGRIGCGVTYTGSLKKKVGLIETESTKVVARGWRAGKYGELSGKAQTCHKLSAARWIRSEDLM